MTLNDLNVKMTPDDFIDLQPVTMDSVAITLQFLNAATGVFPPNIVCKQLLAFPVIADLIEVLD